MRLRHAIPIAACLWFFLTAQVFVPALGVQNDEARFTAPIYVADFHFYSHRIGPWDAPLMLASYVGTLKTLIWWPLFALFGTSAWTLREPAILCGVLTIFLFHHLVRRIAGERAAAIACVLLAVDPMFLLTTCYDWGPGALQHLLLVAGTLAAVAGAWLGAGFLFGIALWDKALALWVLSGLAVATIVRYPRVIQLRRAATIAGAKMAGAVILGMLPLILYNIHSRLGTLRENAVADTTPLAVKVLVMRNTFDGSALFGFLDYGPLNAHHDWMLAAFFVALAATPLAGRRERRAIVFALLTLAIAWTQMLWTTASGASVHHTILLWPLPQFIMGVAFAAASRRFGARQKAVAAGATLALALSCSFVTLQYAETIQTYGGRPNWSTALNSLSDYLTARHPARVYLTDWGFTNNIALHTAGRLPLTEHLEIDPSGLYVARVERPGEGSEVFPERNRALLAEAAKLGYHPQTETVIQDGHGRSLFQVYRMAK